MPSLAQSLRSKMVHSMFPPEPAAICWAAVARWVGVQMLGGASTRYLQCRGHSLECKNQIYGLVSWT